VSYGSRELGNNRGGDPKAATEELRQSGVNSVFYVSPDTAHEWQSWRRSLKEFAPLVFNASAAAAAATTAGITGDWKTEFESQVGPQKYTYHFKQDGQKLSGKADAVMRDQKREVELLEGKVDGDKVSFVEMLKFQDNEIRITYTGTISGNEMKLTRAVGDFAKEEIVVKREATRRAE
jgi:hypothetical protein